ncbi:unnamed protein product [Schistocephalus solidus]|uniref:Uncharacterized protein n=1 Tax=Schistocephalus solidus TaxID=70667 RepID=A0A183S8Y7_SCHSO|nr:unnamed protein product [Schistocephalus solidus]
MLMAAYRDEHPVVRIAYRPDCHFLNSWRMHAITRHSSPFCSRLNTAMEEDMQRSMDLFSKPTAPIMDKQPACTKLWSCTNHHPTPNTMYLESLSTKANIKLWKFSLIQAVHSYAASKSREKCLLGLQYQRAFSQPQPSVCNCHSLQLKIKLKSKNSAHGLASWELSGHNQTKPDKANSCPTNALSNTLVPTSTASTPKTTPTTGDHTADFSSPLLTGTILPAATPRRSHRLSPTIPFRLLPPPLRAPPMSRQMLPISPPPHHQH